MEFDMELKDYIAESFNKAYGYKIKIAADCGAEQMSMLENCLKKYNLVSASAWKRAPIQENPMEFVRHKGAQFTSEVCSTDVVLKYPVNERILEVWIGVHMGLGHDRVLVYGDKEPRKLETENAAARTTHNKDREVTVEDAVLNDADQAHYEMQNPDMDGVFFGEEYNKKFLEELKKIRAEKGSKYFSNYPTKGQLMGDDLRPMWDTLHGMANMGRGLENKEVDVISQSGRRN
jgi:hypothetical protein